VPDVFLRCTRFQRPDNRWIELKRLRSKWWPRLEDNNLFRCIRHRRPSSFLRRSLHRPRLDSCLFRRVIFLNIYESCSIYNKCLCLHDRNSWVSWKTFQCSHHNLPHIFVDEWWSLFDNLHRIPFHDLYLGHRRRYHRRGCRAFRIRHRYWNQELLNRYWSVQSKRLEWRNRAWTFWGMGFKWSGGEFLDSRTRNRKKNKILNLKGTEFDDEFRNKQKTQIKFWVST